ncbi:MAG: acylphosphatase [Methanoregulaceae archaeon]|jgi:acylphosphatase
MKTLQLFISGRVQSVGFRACIRRIATDMNIRGMVMNLPDGRVQVYATGEPIVLEKFISMLYGCPRVSVRDVRITDVNLKQFDDFSIIKGNSRLRTGL